MDAHFIIALAVITYCDMGLGLSYWPVFLDNHNAASPATSTCCKETPCYDVVLVNIRDGLTSFDQTPGLLERTFVTAGSNRGDALRFGRDALEFFRVKYGLEFPSVTDEQLLDSSSGIMNTNGDAMFQPFLLSSQARHRIYVATFNEEAQFLNLPFDVYGFNVIMNSARQSTGTFNQTIPGGARVFYGFYTIDQCPPSRHGNCHHSILTPNNPREKITIRFTTQAYNLGSLPPTNYFFADLDLYHPVWGQGASHGYFPARPGINGVTDGREVLTFPVYRS